MRNGGAGLDACRRPCRVEAVSANRPQPVSTDPALRAGHGPRRSGGDLRARIADEPAASRPGRRHPPRPRKRTHHRPRDERHHGGIHAPESAGQPVLGRHLGRVLRRQRPRHRHRGDEAPSRTVHARNGTVPHGARHAGYLVDLVGNLHDLRGRKGTYPLVYHDDSYAVGQNLARRLRGDGSNGIVYDSVRRADGECAAVFLPRLLSNCRQERHLCYVWDGTRIATVYEKSVLET